MRLLRAPFAFALRRNAFFQAFLPASLLVGTVLATAGAGAKTPKTPVSPRVPLPTPAVMPALPKVPAVAPGYAAPRVSPQPPAIVGITSQAFVGIKLQDVLAMALIKDPNLAIAYSNNRISGYQIVAARGVFDVGFGLEPSIKHVTTAPQNAFFAGPRFGPIVQNIQKVEAGVQGVLPAGTKYSARLSSSKEDDNTVINTFNPYFPSTLNIQVTQPLLRDRRDNGLTHQLRLAIVDADVTQAQTLATISQSLEQVTDAYWDLVAAWRNVAIQEAALRDAIAQQRSDVRLARQGVAANVDVVEASSQVATFTDNVYSALQTVSQLQNGLKSLMLSDPADPIWRANLVPTSSVFQLPRAPTLAALIAKAQAQRPEVRQVAAARRQAEENYNYAKNQALPQVNLDLGYTSNGFAGQLNNSPTLSALLSSFGPLPPVPNNLIGKTGQSLANTFDNRFPTYNVGLSFAMQFGGHTSKAELAIAQEQRQQVAIQSNGLSERIQAEAANALQAYQSALSRLSAARSARQAGEQVYSSEVRKFRNGASTTYLVLQRQVELAGARGRELQAQTDLNKAVTEIQRVSGDILIQNNIKLGL